MNNEDLEIAQGIDPWTAGVLKQINSNPRLRGTLAQEVVKNVGLHTDQQINLVAFRYLRELGASYTQVRNTYGMTPAGDTLANALSVWQDTVDWLHVIYKLAIWAHNNGITDEVQDVSM